MAHDNVNPLRDWAEVMDCGDIFNSAFDKYEAVQQLGKGLNSIASRKAKNVEKAEKVRTIVMGGDHTISKCSILVLLTPVYVLVLTTNEALPALRALFPIWGELAVIHFDSHLDTWNPAQWGGGVNKYDKITHGTLLHFAHEEGLLRNDTGIHVGSRSLMFDPMEDLKHDAECGFQFIMATEIDRIGVERIIERIVERVGENAVYVTIDIDVLDPGQLLLHSNYESFPLS